MFKMKTKYVPFERASVLRKFSILYFLMSILPISMLYYLYFQIKDQGNIVIDENSYFWALFLIVLGVGVGFVVMRSILVKLIDITKKNRQAVESLLGSSPDQIDALEDNNELAILAKSFNEITAHLEENVHSLQTAKKTLHSVLARVGEGITTMQSIDSFLNLILETVTNALQCEAGILLLKVDGQDAFYIKDISGRVLDEKQDIRIEAQAPLFREVLESKKVMIINTVPSHDGWRQVFQPPMLCAPMVLHDDVMGLLCVCGDGRGDGFQNDDKELLANLALQTAVAIENSKLNDDVERTYFETISALALAVEAKDPYSRGHSERVANLAVKISQELKLSEDIINDLRDAAKLHDIGKIGITDDILKKNGPLDTEETRIMNKHVLIGEGIIKPIHSLQRLCDLIRHHHEKLDGSGYPDGLRAKDISLPVRILAVADIYDALTSERPYRKALEPLKAIDLIRGMKDQVDQKVVDSLKKIQIQ